VQNDPPASPEATPAMLAAKSVAGGRSDGGQAMQNLKMNCIFGNSPFMVFTLSGDHPLGWQN